VFGGLGKRVFVKLTYCGNKNISRDVKGHESLQNILHPKLSILT